MRWQSTLSAQIIWLHTYGAVLQDPAGQAATYVYPLVTPPASMHEVDHMHA